MSALGDSAAKFYCYNARTRAEFTPSLAFYTQSLTLTEAIMIPLGFTLTILGGILEHVTVKGSLAPMTVAISWDICERSQPPHLSYYYTLIFYSPRCHTLCARTIDLCIYQFPWTMDNFDTPFPSEAKPTT